MKPAGLAAALLGVFCLGAGLGAAAEQEGPPPAAPVQIVCTLDRPVVGRHQVDDAAVVTDAPAGTSLHYHWTATGGRFVNAPSARGASSAAVLWDPGGTALGRYKLSVQVMSAERRLGACSVEVLVAEAVRSAPEVAGSLGRWAARALLVRGSDEREQYGLYSYILLAARPDDDRSRDRFKEVLQSYLDLVDINLETYLRTEELNATYVPVDGFRQDPNVDWVLDHYDYARAQGLLAHAGIREGDGPFIISAFIRSRRQAGPGNSSSRIFRPYQSACCRSG